MGDMTEPKRYVAGEPIPAGHPVGVAANGSLVVQKYGACIPVSRADLVWSGQVKPTEVEQREMDEWRASYDARKQAATEAWPVFVAALGAVTDPVARVVLNIHWNENGHCRGCEYGGYEAEPPAWPCGTTTSVAAAVGITVPPGLDMAEQASQW